MVIKSRTRFEKGYGPIASQNTQRLKLENFMGEGYKKHDVGEKRT
jgi:hypothetical protein